MSARSPTIWPTSMRALPEHFTEAKDFLLSNMYEEEIGGDRHTDLLIRFAEACGTTRRAREGPGQHVADHARPAKLVLCGRDARGPDRRRRRPGRRAGIAGALDLSPADPDACARSTSSPTRRSSSSTCISSPTKSTASAATRSCCEHANTLELQQRCLKICEVGAQMRLLYTTALYSRLRRKRAAARAART